MIKITANSSTNLNRTILVAILFLSERLCSEMPKSELLHWSS